MPFHEGLIDSAKGSLEDQGSAQEFDEVQAGVMFTEAPISVHSAVCETTT
jgi:hypothetical protein